MKKITLSVFIPVAAVLLCIFILQSCNKEKPSPAPASTGTTNTVPTVTTTAVSSITQTTAQSGGRVTSDGGSTVTARGVCYGTSQNPTIANSVTTNGTDTGSFTSSLTNLSANTTYYVRAYATNSTGTGYGNELTFSTQAAASTVTDVDGNVYNTVIIGTQTWMKENLKTAHYQNGAAIGEVEDSASWANLYNTNIGTPAWCIYENNAANGTTYGKLYNYYAVVDPRNVCPTGWHAPSDSEWEVLANYIGTDASAGGHLKATTLWESPNTDADNSSGFTALPGGDRLAVGSCSYIGILGFWWTTTESALPSAYFRELFWDQGSLNKNNNDKYGGYSVRCVKN